MIPQDLAFTVIQDMLLEKFVLVTSGFLSTTHKLFVYLVSQTFRILFYHISNLVSNVI